jgi:hypothetical protein
MIDYTLHRIRAGTRVAYDRGDGTVRDARPWRTRFEEAA